MQANRLPAVLVVTALSSALGASAAYAACDGIFGSRPGTPNELRAEPIPGGTIRFSWRNTTGKGLNKSGSTSQGDTPHRMWFDINIREDKAGTGTPLQSMLPGAGTDIFLCK